MKHTITLIPGEGIGPEIIEYARVCLEATGIQIKWDVIDVYANMLRGENNQLPKPLLESLSENKVALKGLLTTPPSTGSVNLTDLLCKNLDLYACIRPCRNYRGITSMYPKTNIIVIKENSEDLSTAIEFESDAPNTEQLISLIKKDTKIEIPIHSSVAIKSISEFGSSRIVRFAFEYALANKRKKVSAITEATIMKYSDGLFMEVAQKLTKFYPSIEFENILVDSFTAHITQYPEKYEVLVLPNLYGEMISYLCAGLIGGLELVPEANIGDKFAIFESMYKGDRKSVAMNKSSLVGTILAGVMMLRYLNEKNAADRLESAVMQVLAEKKSITYDFNMVKAIVDYIRDLKPNANLKLHDI